MPFPRGLEINNNHDHWKNRGSNGTFEHLAKCTESVLPGGETSLAVVTVGRAAQPPADQ